MKPSFLIIGGQKCGTTSLYQYLCEHPQVVSARRKEVSFFTGNFNKGNNWYLKQFPRVESQEIITGEASPNYIFYPHTPQRVYEFFPEMKLVALLRDPVERAISHYYHNRKMNQIIKKGKKREPLSFEMAIERENRRIKGDIKRLQIDNNYNRCYNFNHYSYLTKGIYVDQLKRWMEVFPREQLLIFKSEHFFKNPSITLKEVLEFLDLPEFELPEYKQRNKGTLKKAKKKSISDSLKLQLAEYFQPHNQRLEEFLGMKFDWDKKYQNLEI
ncbi:MAG: sulfotransferase domain-containing protein [Cyanobacteriota bacterium]|nr:sulfotransferase domain-containing protein [Cyanobacteriota bacterium]